MMVLDAFFTRLVRTRPYPIKDRGCFRQHDTSTVPMKQPFKIK